MTPDITQLAQSEINDALAQLKQISEYPTPSTQYALVLRKYITSQAEALEKAQQRIDELDSRTVKLPEPFKLAKSSSGLTYYYADEVDAALTAAVIKVEDE